MTDCDDSQDDIGVSEVGDDDVAAPRCPSGSNFPVFLISEIINIANRVKNKHSRCENCVELLPYLGTSVDFQSF